MNNGTPSRRHALPTAPSSDGDLRLRSSHSRLHDAPRRHGHKKNKITHCHYALVLAVMAAFVLFQIYFLHQLARYHDDDRNNRSIPWPAHDTKRQQRPGAASAAAAASSSSARANAKQPPKPAGPPPPKTSLLPKHVVTVFGPESSGTTFLATALGVAVGAFDPRGKWNYMPGNSWTIPNDGHVFVEAQRWVLEKSLGRRAQSSDGAWEIQHLSLPWGWYCEEDRPIEIVEALVPEECWRYAEDSHVSPKSAEMIWYGAAKRKKKRFADRYANPDNFAGVEKIPRRKPEQTRIIELCKNELHITQENEKRDKDGGVSDWTCGAKCGTGAYDGFALYPKRFSVNITSHIEWYASRGVKITAILSARDRSISTKSKLQDHCKLDIGKEEDDVALQLMTEALERYGKRGSDGDRERALVVSYEGLMGIGKAHLFDLYRKLGINSTYVPTFADGNNKYVTPYKKPKKQRQPEESRTVLQNIPIIKNLFSRDVKDSDGKAEKEKDGTDNPDLSKMNEPPPKPSVYERPPPKKKLLPKRVIAVFGPESSGTTFLTSVLGVATGAFPEEGKWVQVLAPNPQNSKDPSNPRMKWKFHNKIPERASTDDGEVEVQHLSLPSGWICSRQPQWNKIHIVGAFVPEECMRYETLPDLDLKLAEQIWYNQHAARPKKPTPMTDTVEDFDWETYNHQRTQDERNYSSQCREEVKISQIHTNRECGAKCGQQEYDGFALYPNRYFVNITSHIEWYLSRGIDITVVISMRDRSISRAAKHREHCAIEAVAEKEDEIAMTLINEAIDNYGTGRNGEQRVILVSYEGLMEFREAYLFDLYYQLGIDSDYVPEFTDGNWKYVTNSTKAEVTGKRSKERPQFFTTGVRDAPPVKKAKMPPADWKPRPPKNSILPRRVITVVGAESSGTTLLSTALGVATGAFNAGGEWYEITTYRNNKRKVSVDQSDLVFKRDAVKKMDFKEAVNRRVTSPDGVEIQHLSLPWGWICDATSGVEVVEALVPEECFRYSRAPNMDPHFAEGYFWSEHSIKVKKNYRGSRQKLPQANRLLSEDDSYFNHEEVMEQCREDARISEGNKEYSCGAKCGTGAYNGFSLYPQRFSINITSHIEWYLSRGVDITVVMSIRDKTISHKGKLMSHCQSNRTAEMENDVARNLMAEAFEKYGKHGTMLRSPDKERVVMVNYESLMRLKEPYLLDLYRALSINSTYVPQFKDGNDKYVVDPVEVNTMYQLEKKQMVFRVRPPKPAYLPPLQQHEFLLPRRLITVFSLDNSRFLSTSIALAAGAFPEGGEWIQESNNEIVYKDTITKSARSVDGEFEVQHIFLPDSNAECQDETATVVEALAPSECSIGLQEGHRTTLDFNAAEQCRDEVFISEVNDSPGAKWTCGALCGHGETDGFTIYPSRYFVNISSHIEWYTSRGVDVTAVLQIRDHNIAKKSFARDKHACGSPMIASREDSIGLNLMYEAYAKYGAKTIGQSVSKRQSKGAERVIIASYETMMQFKEAYLLRIFQQLGINSHYVQKLKAGDIQLNFVDENSKYIRTPPRQKKTSHNAVEHRYQYDRDSPRVPAQRGRNAEYDDDLTQTAAQKRKDSHRKKSEEYDIE